MKIVIASDHRGIELKEEIIDMLQTLSHEVDDRGPFIPESVDYPIYASKVAKQVASHQADYGIIICGSGIGVAIAANKTVGIRAATCRSVDDARGTRNHNNANVLCLGADVTATTLATSIVLEFINTHFEGGRHQRRVDLIE